MSREIYIQDKYFASPYLRLVQGEQNTSVYRFQMDRYENSVDRGIFTYSITGRNAQGDLNFGPLSKIVSPQSVVLEWTIGPNFTAGAGPMQLQITGRDPSGQQLAVFEGEVVEVAPNLSDAYETTPDYAQQILEGAKDAASRAESAAEGIEQAENRSEEYARQAGESAASAKSDADRAAQMIGEGEEIRENVEAWIEDIRGILTQDVAGELAAGVADLNADVQSLDTEMETKASRVQDAVSGNLAMLDGNGDLADSGKAAARVALLEEGSGRLSADVLPSLLDAERLAGKEAWEYRRGRNLLDNWYFGNPVNQRGQTSYTSGYGIDRWTTSGAGSYVEVTAGGIKAGIQSEASSGNRYPFYQKIEHPELLIGKTVVLSAQVKEKTEGTPRLALRFAQSGGEFISQSLTEVTGPGVFSVSAEVPENTGELWAGVVYVANSTENDSVTLAAAKLELGDTQTLAHQDAEGNWVLSDAPPNFEEELLKCQRYQVVLEANGGIYSSSVGAGAAVVVVFIPVPVSMRVSPTIVSEGNKVVCNFFASTGAYSQKNCTVSGKVAVSNGVKLTLTPDSPIGSAAYISVNTVLTSKVILDSNL